MKRYPLDTLTLPYVCADASCSCHEVGDDTHRVRYGIGLTVRPVREQYGWSVLVEDDRGFIDAFVGHTLNDALGDLHREFPMAHFDPEGAS